MRELTESNATIPKVGEQEMDRTAPLDSSQVTPAWLAVIADHERDVRSTRNGGVVALGVLFLCAATIFALCGLVFWSVSAFVAVVVIGANVFANARSESTAKNPSRGSRAGLSVAAH